MNILKIKLATKYICIYIRIVIIEDNMPNQIVYVNKKTKEDWDRLKRIAILRDVPISELVHEAIVMLLKKRV